LAGVTKPSVQVELIERVRRASHIGLCISSKSVEALSTERDVSAAG